MADLQRPMAIVVQRFTDHVSAAAHEMAAELVAAAVAAAQATVARRRAPAAHEVAAAESAISDAKNRGKGAKRPPTEIARARTQLLDFIRRRPGLRVEEINEALGSKTAEVVLPLRKLVAEGLIRTEGVKRSMRYYPSGSVKSPVPAASLPAPTVRRRR